MRKYLAHFLAVVMAIVMAAPAAAAPQKAEKATPKGIAAPLNAKKPNELNLNSYKKTAVPGQGQFMRHKVAVPGKKQAKKHFAPMHKAGSANFYACLTYSSEWPEYDRSATGIYTFTTASPVVIEKATPEDFGIINLNDGGTATDTQIVGTYYNEFWGMAFINTYIYDRDTYSLISSTSGNITARSRDMTWDPVTKNVYGIFLNDQSNGFNFAIFNPEQGGSTAVAPLKGNYTRIAAAKDGTIYLLDESGNIATINKETGEVTTIGNFGVTSDYPCSASIDFRSGLIYYATCLDSSPGELYTIDPANPNEANLVYQFPADIQFTCAYFPVMKAENGAPDVPAINSLTFEGANMRGKINFSMPSTHYDGETAPAGETLRYEILANDEVIAQGGKLQYGHSYTLNIEVPAPNLYTFKVVAYNEAGPSPIAEKQLYVGPDAPAAVQNVVAAFADDEMTITWNAVTEGAHNGILGNVTYNVYEAETGKLLAEAITETHFSFDMAEPVEYTTCSYKVVAVADGLESVAGISNTLALGALNPPYASALTSEADIDGWNIIDANNDGKVWQVSQSGIMLTYNYDIAADDYAVAPPIRVKKGYAYNVSVAVATLSPYNTEAFEIVALSSADNTADAKTVIPKTETNSTEFNTYQNTFIPTDDAVVCFAIHGVSEAGRSTIYVKDFAVGAAVKAAAPAAASEVVIAPDINGTAKATVTFVAPDKAVDGSALSSIDKIEVRVGDKVKHTERKPTPGASYSAEVETDGTGTLEFSVVAYNAAGAGSPASATAFVGVPLPAAPTGATVEEVSEGVVTIKWDAVTTSADGKPINPDLVTYAIVDAYASETVAMDVVGTEYANLEVVKPGEQAFAAYAIFAMTTAGINEQYVMTKDIVVGTPYNVPFVETVANGELENNWIFVRSSDFIKVIIGNDSNYDVTSRNNDNGFFLIDSKYRKEYLNLISGKIKVSGDEPYLTFYTYNASATDENVFEVNVACEGDTTNVLSFIVGEGEVGNWNRHSVNLKNYAGKTVQLIFHADIVNNSYVYFDDITVGDPVKYDLYAKSISAPSSQAPNNEFDINYEVQNLGIDKASGYSVQIYADGDLLETITDLPELEPGATYVGKFTHKPYSLFEAGTYQFNFVVAYALDQELANNTSATIAVKVKNTKFPVTEITGDVNEKTVTLNWENPLIDTSASEVTEDFDSEDYPAFTTTSFGDWTLVNKNNNPTYLVDGGKFPNAGEAFGWILFDASSLGYTEGSNIYGYEGSCYMAAFAHEEGANDAWLISPELEGLAQTVTFMAKCATAEYGAETMECLYSTTDANTESFTKAEISGYNEATGVTEDWAEYSFSVPTGTKYFAIRSTATDCFILMVDNITYLGAPAFATLEHIGFDVYRNGEKLNALLPLLGTSFTDTVEDYGTYTYNVVCVYNEGVSAPSNSFVADIKDTGIADATAASAISVEGNTIVVTGATSVMIAAADGKVVYTAEGNDNCRAIVAAGVYVVKTNDATAKVIVK